VFYQDVRPTDNSYAGNHQIGDMFLHLAAELSYKPYISHNQDGAKDYTRIHGHLLTPFFSWRGRGTICWCRASLGLVGGAD
jgi:hypothetical protein